MQLVTQGVIAGMVNPNSILDYSGGGTTSHGNDFRYPYPGTTTYKDYYLAGFNFTNSSHDIWKMGSHSNKRTLTGIVNKEKVEYSYLHKYLSTGAAGGSVFLKRTVESFGEGYPAVKQAILQGDMEKAKQIVSGLKGTAAY